MGREKLINHPHVWRGVGSHPSWNTHSTGFEALDNHLPGGGWPAGGLTEIIVEHYGIGELSLLMPALVRLGQDVTRSPGWILWISPPYIPYAPALRRQGIDLSRVLLVRKSMGSSAKASAERSDTLWAMEQALRQGSCAAVLAWVKSADETALRRLQLAAEEGQCWAVLFRPLVALHQRSPAALRIRLMGAGGLTQVEILKCRGGRPGVIPIQHDDYPGDPGDPEW